MEKVLLSGKDMVISILKGSKTPLMAKKIARNIYKKYDGFMMSRFMVRDILWKKLKGQFVYDNVNYTYWMENKEIVKTDLRIDNIGIDQDSSSLNKEIYDVKAGNLTELINKYHSLEYTQNRNKRDSNFSLTQEVFISKELSKILREIVKEIVSNNIGFKFLKDTCNKSLLNNLIASEKITTYFKIRVRTSPDLSYYEKLLEFKLVCQDAWEDGIITKKEQRTIDRSVIQLGIKNEDVKNIFNQLKGENQEIEIDKNVDENESFSFDKIISIDNIPFHIKIIDQPMSPLFWHKFESNIEVIYVNKSHHQFKDFEINILLNIIAVLCKTKLSLSDESGEIFVNRFKNYLNLINLKK